ncbi:hypothetical protein M8J77_017082 [Diaphorina citri]|nr:hypothetical protein M8J77_017082 [Diaphorina citri]
MILRIKFHTSAGIEPTPSCLPVERLDHYTTEAGDLRSERSLLFFIYPSPPLLSADTQKLLMLNVLATLSPQPSSPPPYFINTRISLDQVFKLIP